MNQGHISVAAKDVGETILFRIEISHHTGIIISAADQQHHYKKNNVFSHPIEFEKLTHVYLKYEDNVLIVWIDSVQHVLNNVQVPWNFGWGQYSISTFSPSWYSCIIKNVHFKLIIEQDVLVPSLMAIENSRCEVMIILMVLSVVLIIMIGICVFIKREKDKMGVTE